MQTWEYSILDSPSVDQLNALGAEGWELVGAATYKLVDTSGPQPVEVWRAAVYLKRPRTEG